MAVTSSEKGQLRLIERMLAKKFGPLSDEARRRLNELVGNRLEELGVALLSASSLRELGLEGEANGHQP